MTAIIKFTALQGALSERHLSYLLEVDGFNVLLDCGWSELFDVADLEPLRRCAPQVDAVLLSQPDLAHCGALPYARAHLGLTCPVYATRPIVQMGQMFLYDAHRARYTQEETELFTLDDVDTAFDSVIALKYSQTLQLPGGVRVTPFAAGRMVGGSIWRVAKDNEDVLYAVDYNHKKERHLNGTVLETLTRPTLMITDALNARYTQAKRKDRDAALFQQIRSTLRRDGSVLLCVDTAGRVLEVMLLLEQLWSHASAGLSVYPLVFLSNVAASVVESAQTMVEYMSDMLMQRFESRPDEHFRLPLVRRAHSMAELQAIPGSKVVLTGLPGLTSGFGRELFLQYAGTPSNLVLFTSKPPPGTLGRQLYDRIGGVVGGKTDESSPPLHLRHGRRVPLQGAELEEHKREQRAKREAEVAERAAAAGMMDVESESEGEGEGGVGGGGGGGTGGIGGVGGGAGGGSGLMGAAVGSKGGGGSSSGAAIRQHDIMAVAAARGRRGFFKEAKTFPMYPFSDEHPQSDVYGELIRPEDFVQAMDTTADGGDKKKDGVADGTELEDSLSGGGGGPADFAEALEETPTKVVYDELRIEIRCQVADIDFEGRSDGESIARILAHVKPRQLVLVHGSLEDCEHLAQACKANTDMHLEDVHMPAVGETVLVTSARDIYRIRLRDALVSSLQFSKVDGHEVAWLQGVCSMGESGSDGAGEDEPMETDVSSTTTATTTTTAADAGTDATLAGKKGGDGSAAAGGAIAPVSAAEVSVLPSLEPIPAGSEGPGHSTVFVGDMRLSDFKNVLVKAGFTAEFSSGVLVCNETVAVRKGRQGLQIEGALSNDYYRIRDLLYGQFAVV